MYQISDCLCMSLFSEYLYFIPDCVRSFALLDTLLEFLYVSVFSEYLYFIPHCVRSFALLDSLLEFLSSVDFCF